MKTLLLFLLAIFLSHQNVHTQLRGEISSAGKNFSQKIDGKFYYVKDWYERNNYVHEINNISGSIRFAQPPSSSDLKSCAELGVIFKSENGRLMHSATIYPASIPFTALDQLAQNPEILFIQCSWRLNHQPLWVSRPQIQTEQVWQLTDNQKRNVTGKGVLVADFDSGVDFFHPMMWFADGDTVNWIDMNRDNLFTRGIDAVDLNKNGKADSNETLNYIELRLMAAGNDTAGYDSDMDWLYNDANNNGLRNRGVTDGYTESSPTYGEQWFISVDQNKNNKLDVGEKLVGLKTCKVRAIRKSDATVFRRGIDLIKAPYDTGPYGGHGTSVCGILCGGIPVEKKMSGIAPDAEVIVAEIDYNSTPRFYTDMGTQMTWARDEGAKIFLVEDGEWVWEFLDGSSNEEILMNELAQDNGIIHVLPAGNLTGGGMMKTITVPKNDTVKVRMNVPPRLSSVWPTFLWKGNSSELLIQTQAPNNDTLIIPFNNARVKLDSSSIFSNITISPRATVRAMIEISPVDSGQWVFTFRNLTSTDKKVYCYLGDNYFSWSGAARWVQPTEDNTVTWPATADSGIGIAAYNPRQNMGINYFSGRGKRLDGFAPVDVACPGSTVYSIGRNNTYVPFGGTSSAGPHGTGAVALLLQKFPNKKFYDIQYHLRLGALQDSLTGNVPNTTWGWGKLRILNAIQSDPTNVISDFKRLNSFTLKQNYPNPFSSSTTIRFWIYDFSSWEKASPSLSQNLKSQSAAADKPQIFIKVFDLLGREVASITNDFDIGEHSVSFNADGLPNGVYFYRLSIAGSSVTKRMVLFR